MSFFKKLFGIFGASSKNSEPVSDNQLDDALSTSVEGDNITVKIREHSEAMVDGLMYWDPSITASVKQLKKEKRFEEAEAQLLKIIEAATSESETTKMGVAPWGFEQLAMIYRRQKKYNDECRILEKFSLLQHAPGVKPEQLIKRLEKSRILRDKQS